MRVLRNAALCAAWLCAVAVGSAAFGAQSSPRLRTESGQINEASAERAGQPLPFSYYTPKGFDPDAKHPLIFLISGNMDFPAKAVLPVVQEIHRTMEPKADVDGTVLVHLALKEQSPKDYWDNLAFIERVYELFVAGMNIDQDRVYATGESGGAAMTFWMSCHMPERLAAIAPSVLTAGMGELGSCARAAPLPVMITTGTADPLVPFEGKSHGPYPVGVPGTDRWLSVEEYILYWRVRNRLGTTPPVETALDNPVMEIHPTRGHQMPSHIIRYDWASSDGNDLVWLKVVGGGHMVPRWNDGKTAPPPPPPAGLMPPPDAPPDSSPVDVIGIVNSDLDGSAAIYDFLLAHRRKGIQQ